MTFDINIDLVLTVDTFDESEATAIAERICGYIERDAEYAAPELLTNPPPLAVVIGVESRGE
jgi:hypothetical protein